MANTRYSRINLQVDVSPDEGGVQKQIFRDRISRAQMVNDTMQSGTLGTSQSLSVPFAEVATANLLYIESSGPIEVMINGQSSPGWTMQPLPNAEDECQDESPNPLARCLLEGVFTSLTIQNPSSSATVDFVVYLCGT